MFVVSIDKNVDNKYVVSKFFIPKLYESVDDSDASDKFDVAVRIILKRYHKIFKGLFKG